MAKFLNKKEQVYDLKLTSYGHHLLSTGKFKPVYYAFYDDNVIYDIRYASGSASASIEPQNNIHERIKENTSYLEGQVLFSEVERNINKITELDFFETDITPTMITPAEDFNKINKMIGDAWLDGDTNKAPAWKVVALDGKILSSSYYDHNRQTHDQQINFDLLYSLKAVDPLFRVNPNEIAQLENATPIFADGQRIVLEPDDAMVYVEEVNTQLLTENFDIEVFHLSGAVGATATYTQESGTPSAITGKTLTLEDALGTTHTMTFNSSAGTTTSTIIYVNGLNKPTIVKQIITAINLARDAGLIGITASRVNPSTISLVMDTTAYPEAGNDKTITGTIINDDSLATAVDFGGGASAVMKRKYFQKDIQQIKDGIMLTETPLQNTPDSYTTNSVEYYFDILTDVQVNHTKACVGAESFNKQSYYVDLDFDCTRTDEEIMFYDIYGPVTEPEICQD